MSKEPYVELNHYVHVYYNINISRRGNYIWNYRSAIDSVVSIVSSLSKGMLLEAPLPLTECSPSSLNLSTLWRNIPAKVTKDQINI